MALTPDQKKTRLESRIEDAVVLEENGRRYGQMRNHALTLLSEIDGLLEEGVLVQDSLNEWRTRYEDFLEDYKDIDKEVREIIRLRLHVKEEEI